VILAVTHYAYQPQFPTNAVEKSLQKNKKTIENKMQKKISIFKIQFSSSENLGEKTTIN